MALISKIISFFPLSVELGFIQLADFAALIGFSFVGLDDLKKLIVFLVSLDELGLQVFELPSNAIDFFFSLDDFDNSNFKLVYSSLSLISLFQHKVVPKLHHLDELDRYYVINDS